MEETKQKQTSEQLASFNKLVKDWAKTREAPYGIKYGFVSSSVFSDGYSIEDINDAKNDLNIELMREISNFYYKTSTSYRRILNYFSYLYKYYYTLDLKHLATDFNENKKDSVKKLYIQTLDFLDHLNIEDTFGFIATRMLIDGAFYGYINFFDDDRVTITMLDPNYCISRYKSPYNTNIVEFDVRFFNKYTDEKELNEALDSFPKSVKSLWRKYQNGTIKNGNYYAMLPPEESCAFQFGGIPVPPFFDTIIDIINFNDYKDIEKRRDTQELEKILVQRFELDEQGGLDVLLEEMETMHEAVSEIFRDNPNIDVLTTIANEVSLKDTQSSTGSVTNNNIEKMLVPKYENAGISFEMFASTTATSLELSISNSTSFMSQAITSFSNWLSMLCLSHFKYKKLEPIVTILPLTWYNEKRLVDMYLKQAQSGYSLILPYVATGKKQSTILDTKTLENDILNLGEILIPPKTSNTMSSEDSSGRRQKGDIQEDSKGPGRPEKPLEEKSEKTIKNINAGG